PQQVHPAHPRLSREPGGDHDDIGPGRVRVVVRPGDQRRVALDRRGLLEVQRQPLGLAVDDVDQADLAEALLEQSHRRRLSDEATADDGDLHTLAPKPMTSAHGTGPAPTARSTSYR